VDRSLACLKVQPWLRYRPMRPVSDGGTSISRQRRRTGESVRWSRWQWRMMKPAPALEVHRGIEPATVGLPEARRGEQRAEPADRRL